MSENKVYIIDHFLKQNAKEYTFKVRDRTTGEFSETTVYDYFRRKYHIMLERWNLPVIQMTKKSTSETRHPGQPH